MLAGAFLAFLALQHEIPVDKAAEPTQMYLVAFSYVFASPEWALAAMVLFVIVSQVKINVTNAYAGSLAWSNFFARVTHSHPGRVVWLVFNVAIALMLMELGVFEAIEQVLGLYANVAIAWIGALVADLVINKPLGLSPRQIEFKRAHLYDINPVGVGSMLIASLLAILAHSGLLGELAQAASPVIALGTALLCAPLIAWLTGGRFYIARERQPELLYPIPSAARSPACSAAMPSRNQTPPSAPPTAHRSVRCAARWMRAVAISASPMGGFRHNGMRSFAGPSRRFPFPACTLAWRITWACSG